MKTICTHDYPSDLCGVCNPMPKTDTPETDSVDAQHTEVHASFFAMRSHAWNMERQRDEARRLAEFWHEVACGKFVTPNGLPWDTKGDSQP